MVVIAPGIVADDFRLNRLRRIEGTNGSASHLQADTPLLFFCSHAHTDHTVGLSSWKSTHKDKIYCSAVTRMVLLKRHASLRPENVVALECGETSVLYYCVEDEGGRRRKRSVSVTLMDAEHMMGSVMFLFRLQGTTTLFTGDFRYDVPSSIHSTLISLGSPRIDNLIVDNTYSMPSYDFPSRKDAWMALKTCLRLYPDDTIFYVALDNLGKEELLVRMAKLLRSHVFTSPSSERWHVLCDAGDDQVVEFPFPPGIFVANDRDARIRVVHKMWVKMRKANLDDNAVLIQPSGWTSGDPHGISAIKDRLQHLGAATWKKDDDSSIAKIVDAETFFNDQASGRFLPNVLPVPYSLHSSRRELELFLGDVDSATRNAGFGNVEGFSNHDTDAHTCFATMYAPYLSQQTSSSSANARAPLHAIPGFSASTENSPVHVNRAKSAVSPCPTGFTFRKLDKSSRSAFLKSRLRRVARKRSTSANNADSLERQGRKWTDVEDRLLHAVVLTLAKRSSSQNRNTTEKQVILHAKGLMRALGRKRDEAAARYAWKSKVEKTYDFSTKVLQWIEEKQ